MGLFSSKKKHHVETTVTRVVKDENIPETAKQSMLTAILGDGDITAGLVSSLKASSVYDFDRMYRYGRDEYDYGLPNDDLSSNTKDVIQAPVQAVIDAMVGVPVDIDYVHMGPMDYTHATLQILTDQFDYNPLTNEIEALSAQKGFTVYLSDIRPVYNQQTLDEAEAGTLTPVGSPATSGYSPKRKAQTGALGQYRRHTEPAYDLDSDSEATMVTIIWEDAAGIAREDVLTFLMDFEDIEADYFMAQFTFMADNIRQVRYMSYEKGEGSFPVLDDLYNVQYTDPGTYFPFVFFRSFGVNRSADSQSNTTLYKTTTEMLEILGMDFAEVGKSIHDNPDIDDVEQAAMVMGVPMNSKDPTELKYLFAFFRRLADNSTQTADYVPDQTFNWFGIESTTQSAQERLKIMDADFSMELKWRGIDARLHAGRVAAIGDVISADTGTTIEETYQIQKRDSSTGELSYTTGIRKYKVKGVTFYQQVTEHTYESVTITDPKLYYYVTKGKGVTADFDDDRFLVPIDRNLSLTMPTLDRERLYLRSMHFVFNSHIVTKTKWYQSGIFQAILLVIAIVITFFSGGTGSPLVAAVLAGAYLTAAYIILVAVVQMYIISEGFKLVAKELGAEFAIIAAIVAAMFGAYQGTGAGIAGAPTATTMLNASTSLMNAASAEIQNDIADVMEELEKTTAEQNEKMDALMEIDKQLDTGGLVDPFVFIGQVPATVLGESPDDFYDRTVHSGNIGTMAYDMLHKYVDLGLKLPTFNDTMRGFNT